MLFAMRVVLTGRPGVGKTTVVKRFLESFKDAVGFYTEEIRKGGRRLGFVLKTTWGDEKVLAHVDINSPYRVSKYGVDVKVLDEVVKRIEESQGGLLVLDEVGKMELFSESFRRFVEKALEEDRALLATAPLKSHHPLVVRLKKSSNLMTVTEGNRDELPLKLIKLFNPSF